VDRLHLADAATADQLDRHRLEWFPVRLAQVQEKLSDLGLLLPGPGNDTFQRTFLPEPQWRGAVSSWATPFPSGPRNAGQSPANAEAAIAQRTPAQAPCERILPDRFTIRMLS
jgi:hypothetical protein